MKEKEMELMLLLGNGFILTENYKPIKIKVKDNFGLNNIINYLEENKILKENSINKFINGSEISNNVFVILFSELNVLTSYSRTEFSLDHTCSKVVRNNIINSPKYSDFVRLLFTESDYHSFAQGFLSTSKTEICEQACKKIIKACEEMEEIDFRIYIENPYLIEDYLERNDFTCEDVDYDYAYSKKFVYGDDYDYVVWVTLRDGSYGAYIDITGYEI